MSRPSKRKNQTESIDNDGGNLPDVRSNILSKISFTLAIMKLFFQADRWLGTSIHILRVNPASTRRPRDVT